MALFQEPDLRLAGLQNALNRMSAEVHEVAAGIHPQFGRSEACWIVGGDIWVDNPDPDGSLEKQEDAEGIIKVPFITFYNGETKPHGSAPLSIGPVKPHDAIDALQAALIARARGKVLVWRTNPSMRQDDDGRWYARCRIAFIDPVMLVRPGLEPAPVRPEGEIIPEGDRTPVMDEGPIVANVRDQISGLIEQAISSAWQGGYDQGVKDAEEQRDKAVEAWRTTLALANSRLIRINALNDNPARFSVEIDREAVAVPEPE